MIEKPSIVPDGAREEMKQILPGVMRESDELEISHLEAHISFFDKRIPQFGIDYTRLKSALVGDGLLDHIQNSQAYDDNPSSFLYDINVLADDRDEEVKASPNKALYKEIWERYEPVMEARTNTDNSYNDTHTLPYAFDQYWEMKESVEHLKRRLENK